ncbi:MAG: SDR family NAD(P)-dependent oxidoreductase [Leptospira sp.]|nr:SDR family NAD(P)-dependent oxidoreductase [Leptospira sp.]
MKPKIILITGSSRGIGETVFHHLKSLGHKVYGSSRSSGQGIDHFQLDVTDPVSCQKVINSIVEKEGRLDVLINNAGKSIRRSVLESTDRYHDVERSMAINFHAPVRLSLSLIQRLIESNGQIIQISAANVLLLPAPFWSAYQSSKVAFDQWFRSVAPELRAKGVAMTSIYLPLVRTKMVAYDAYKNYPAMHPDHVANIIFKKVINRGSCYKPWWLPLMETISFIFRSIINFWMFHKIKRSEK